MSNGAWRPTPAALLCRTSDYGSGPARGAQALAGALAMRWSVEAELLGAIGEGRRGHWRDDLRDAAGCLAEAGRHVDAELAAGRTVVLCSGHCPPCLATLPAVAQRRPRARILWIDAHPDFNTPETTPSDFLGGMCLAGACGLWPSGVSDPVSPAQVVVTGARDIDPGERVVLAEAGVSLLEPAAAPVAVAGAEIFVHLDLDVLDPSVLPGLEFPAPDGLRLDELEALLRGVAEGATLLGIEITDCSASEMAPTIADLIVRSLAPAGLGPAGPTV